MKLLFSLYCDPLIRQYFSSSIPSYAPFDETDINEGPLPPPQLLHDVEANSHDVTKQRRAYQRFYRAITAHWVAVESLCLAKVTNHEKSSQHNHIFGYVWRIWTNNPNRPLPEKLDVLEVTDFVWGFLGRKVFHGIDKPSVWLQSEPEESRWLFSDEQFSENENWSFFVRTLAQHLRPPDIIELLLVGWSRELKWEINKVDYLRTLGLFREPASVQQVDEARDPDTFFDLITLEEDVVNSLTAEWDVGNKNTDHFRMRWNQYRIGMWNYESRAVRLYAEEETDEVFQKILG